MLYNSDKILPVAIIIEGTTFETVYYLYKVDEILRDTFRQYIEKAEVYYRTQIAYGFSIAK